MFEGEKTTVFWLGFIILGLASISLFSMLWYMIVVTFVPDYWKFLVPPIVGGFVFILIGLYMMKSGTKKKEEGKTQLLTQ